MSTRHDSPGDSGASPLVRATRADDAAALSRCLADAFQDDPSFVWVIPDPDDRARNLATFFGIVTDAILDFGECYHISFGGERTGTVAAALWVPPLRAPLTGSQISLLRNLFDNIGHQAADRFVALTELMDAQHPKELHFYLWFLGVAPTYQSQGWGSRLLRSKLDWCDEHQLNAYLEATNDRNRELYQRHGFRVTGKLTVDGSLTLWTMWRQPHPRRAGDNPRTRDI